MSGVAEVAGVATGFLIFFFAFFFIVPLYALLFLSFKSHKRLSDVTAFRISRDGENTEAK